MPPKQKLELTWVGKDERPKLEPRILLEDREQSYHARERRSTSDLFDNRLIFGDNLLALKALEAEFAGKVKCVFIDPPYNTGSAFEHFEDGLEHSIWLGMMRDRLELIRRLLSMDGSLWITIDDNEAHYLRVLCDEVGPKRSLLILCSAFRAKHPARWTNLTVKKIPKAVLDKCEWGRDDYSLAIQNLPTAEPLPKRDNHAVLPRAPRVKTDAGPSLFDAAEPKDKPARRGRSR